MPRVGDDVPAELRRPFTPEAIRWKVQSTWGGGKDGAKTGGMVVPYVDARTVIERLDHVCGLDWADSTQPVAGSTKEMICHLTVAGTTRSDVGESTHSLKGAASDALKRAAVRFGVAASIYAMNRVILNATPNGAMQGQGDKARPTLKQKQTKGKQTLELTDAAEAWLREMYGRWLATPPIKSAFGEPLSHGETPETLGLEGADQRPPAEEDPEADAKVREIEQLYDSLTPEQKRKKMHGSNQTLTKARFGAQLAHARENPEDLDRLEAELNERKAS